ncbi:MAG: 3-deoxy-D-manno-octulosonic acid transferase [Pirellulales bacterium]|nr:3-deoxy-D-manno-octulosonic acid transferase [Pirellulales bacterium]
MSYLLNALYLVALVACAPWLAWRAIVQGKNRSGWSARLLGLVPRRHSLRPCVWLHAVSVGEVNLLTALVREFERREVDCDFVISTTTVTGFELARKRHPQRTVFYCPLDFSWGVRRAIARLRPELLVLVELELWPNLVRLARRAGVRVAVVNGRLSEKSFRGYRRIRPLVAHLLGEIDLIAAQNTTYAERFLALGAPSATVHVTGSMKFDGVETDRRNAATVRLAELAGIAAEDVVLLAGSTQEPEEEIAVEVWRSLVAHWPRLRLILVPRHAERFDAVAALLRARGVPFVRRSGLGECRVRETLQSDGRCSSPGTLTPDPAAARGEGSNGVPETHQETSFPLLSPVEADADAAARDNDAAISASHSGFPPVLLVDTIGELGAWWGTAQIAFVGGSLGNRGGQNMLEPAAYGAAVSFGPNTRNFRDIVAALLEAEGAVVVHDGQELTTFVRRCLADAEFAGDLGRRAQQLVVAQQGATRATVDLLLPLVPSAALASEVTEVVRRADPPAGARVRPQRGSQVRHGR